MHAPPLPWPTVLASWTRPLVAVLFLIVSPRGIAVDALRVDIGDVTGNGWTASDVHVALELPGGNETLARVSASRVTFPEPVGSLERVTVTCRNPIIREPVFRCQGAEVSGRLGNLGTQRFKADIAYDSGRASLEFSLRGLVLAGGEIRVAGSWTSGGWRLGVDARSARLGELRRIMAAWIEVPGDLTIEGRASFRVDLLGGESLDRLDIDATLGELTASNEAGTLAADQVGLEIRAQARSAGPDWLIDADVRAPSGQAYGDPVFVDFAAHALRASLRGRWVGETRRLELERLDFDHSRIAQGRATGQLEFTGDTLLKALRLELRSVEFPGAYATLLRPFLLDSDFKDLETVGRVSGNIDIESGAPAAIDLAIQDVSAQDRGGRMAMQGMVGRVAWQSATRRASVPGFVASPSELSWRGATIYGIAGGPAQLRFATSGGDFRLLESTELPILDGGLRIDTLAVRGLGSPDMGVRFDAELQPISIAPLSKAFGWPEFAGTLSGRIPQVTLENRVLAFGGDIEATVFDGRVAVNGLRLSDPLGRYPRLQANLSMKNLDLEAVTGTFSFGTITGRLDGEIRNLELFQWAPVRFDARFYTPPGDRSRHLISQRAVNNLSSIGGGGGGVTAALSSGFLRFFDNFRYKRLGLSCRLENDVCHMDGIEPASGAAYYIVKGSGIPRIDIIGNAHRVSWQRLVGQLQAIQQSGGPELR